MSKEPSETVAEQSQDPFAADIVDSPDMAAKSPPSRRGWNACLIGCLVILLLAALVCGGVGWYVYANLGQFKTVISDAAREAIVAGIRDSDLEEDEKQAIIAQVDRVVEKYKSGQITTQQLQRVMQELAESPLMGAILIYTVETQYVQPSGLGDEEKQQAQRTLQRVLRGVTERKIRVEELESAMEHVTVEQANGTRQLKNKISDEELRSFLAELKDKADQAEIPDEPFEIRISEEFRNAIDRALGEE